MTYQLVICELILVDGKQWQQWMVIRPYWICPCGSQRTRVRHTVALKQYSKQTRTAQRCRVERTVLRPLSPFPFPHLVCCRSVPGRELGLRGMGTAKNNMRPTDEIKAAQHNTTHRSRHCEASTAMLKLEPTALLKQQRSIIKIYTANNNSHSQNQKHRCGLLLWPFKDMRLRRDLVASACCLRRHSTQPTYPSC